VLGAEAHVGIGGHMKYELGVMHGAVERIGIQQVAMFEAEVRRAQRGLQKLNLPRGEIVETCDRMFIGEQTVHQVTADEAGRAGYQDFQGFSFLPLVLAATV
jgi:hypothetical protein